MSEKEVHELQIAVQQLSKTVDELKKSMQPMIDTYDSFNRLGSWAKYILVFSATLVGMFWTILQIVKFFSRKG